LQNSPLASIGSQKFFSNVSGTTAVHPSRLAMTCAKVVMAQFSMRFQIQIT